MPHPRGRRHPTPDELAKQIAQRLSESSPPPEPGFSWRNSIVVGRLISGSFVVVFAVAVVGVVLAGVTWLGADVGEVEPEVLSANVGADSSLPPSEGSDGPSAGSAPSVLTEPNTPTSFGALPVTVSEDSGDTTSVTLLPPTTTIDPGDVGPPTSSATTSTSGTGSTSQAPASTTSSTAPTTTTPRQTTTTPPPTTTTTTIPPSTTTTVQATTTTTVATTTTTCRNNGRGPGAC
ncbi:MAG TPA: hypothetical protein VMP13_08035 [Acidimicrobiia bacterium]|nr:hypothetical protein [Acidimicrobiia bacterium]